MCLRLCTLAFEYEETLDSLQHLAYFDTLTRLPNRGMLEREAKRILSEARMAGASVAVPMLDVDYFKRYNDTHGHPAGERALRLIASRIAGDVLRPGGVAGRYGGEETCVVLQDAGQAEAVAIAESIREAVEKGPFEDVAGRKDSLTVSVGVAVFDGWLAGPGPSARTTSGSVLAIRTSTARTIRKIAPPKPASQPSKTSQTPATIPVTLIPSCVAFSA